MLAVIQGPPLSPLTLRRVSLPVYCLLALNSHATDSTDEKGGLCPSHWLLSSQEQLPGWMSRALCVNCSLSDSYGSKKVSGIFLAFLYLHTEHVSSLPPSNLLPCLPTWQTSFVIFKIILTSSLPWRIPWSSQGKSVYSFSPKTWSLECITMTASNVLYASYVNKCMYLFTCLSLFTFSREQIMSFSTLVNLDLRRFTLISHWNHLGSFENYRCLG